MAVSHEHDENGERFKVVDGCGCCSHCQCTGSCQDEHKDRKTAQSRSRAPSAAPVPTSDDSDASFTRNKLVSALATVPHPHDTIGKGSCGTHRAVKDRTSTQSIPQISIDNPPSPTQSSHAHLVQSPSSTILSGDYLSVKQPSHRHGHSHSRPSSPARAIIEEYASRSASKSHSPSPRHRSSLTPLSMTSHSTSLTSLTSCDKSSTDGSCFTADKTEHGHHRHRHHRQHSSHHSSRHRHRHSEDEAAIRAAAVSTPELGTFQEPLYRVKSTTALKKRSESRASKATPSTTEVVQEDVHDSRHAKSMSNVGQTPRSKDAPVSRSDSPPHVVCTAPQGPPPTVPLPTPPELVASPGNSDHYLATTTFSLGPLKVTRSRSRNASASKHSDKTVTTMTAPVVGTIAHEGGRKEAVEAVSLAKFADGPHTKHSRSPSAPISSAKSKIVEKVAPTKAASDPVKGNPSPTTHSSGRQDCDYGSLYAVKKFTIQHAPPHMPNTLFFVDWSLRNDNNEPLVAYRIQAVNSHQSSHMTGFVPKTKSNDWLIDAHENGSKLKDRLTLAAGVHGPALFEIDIKRRKVDRFVVRGTPSHMPKYEDHLHRGEQTDYRHVYCNTPDGRRLEWHLEQRDKLMRLIGLNETDQGKVYGEARVQQQHRHGHGNKSAHSHTHSHDHAHEGVTKDTQLFFYNPTTAEPSDARVQPIFKGEDPHMDYAYLCATWFCARQQFDESVVAVAHAESELIGEIERGPFEVDLLGGV